jgi:hypothetical protein
VTSKRSQTVTWTETIHYGPSSSGGGGHGGGGGGALIAAFAYLLWLLSFIF